MTTRFRLTIALDPAVGARLDRRAQREGKAAAELAAASVADYVTTDAEHAAEIEATLCAADAGDFASDAEVSAAKRDDSCMAKRMKDYWSIQEKWAWDAIVSGPAPGNVADLAQYNGRPLERKRPTHDKDFIISCRFLQDIFTDRDLQACITLHGVHISHAVFNEYVDLAHIRVNHKVRFDQCVFTNEVNLEDVNITSWLSFAGSIFRNPGKELRLRGARLHELDLTNVICFGSITMDGAKIGSHVLLQNLRCQKALDIVFADIAGSIDMSGAILNEVNLSSSKMGEIRMGAVSAAPGDGQPQTKWIPKSSMLTLSNTSTNSWQDRGEQPFCNAAIPENDPYFGRTRVQAWPSRIKLDGFSFQNLGGYVYAARRSSIDHSQGLSDNVPNSQSSMLTRDVDYLIKFLALDVSEAVQPYHNLAKFFRSVGSPEKADKIAYAGRELERRIANSRSRKIWLVLLKSTIGYGIGRYTWRVLSYVAFFTVLGGLLTCTILSYQIYLISIDCMISSVNSEDNVKQIAELKLFPNAMIYSFNQLVPLFKLESRFDKIMLPSCLQWYFYIHKIVGWFLGSVLIAAVAGLTQRQS